MDVGGGLPVSLNVARRLGSRRPQLLRPGRRGGSPYARNTSAISRASVTMGSRIGRRRRVAVADQSAVRPADHPTLMPNRLLYDWPILVLVRPEGETEERSRRAA